MRLFMLLTVFITSFIVLHLVGSFTFQADGANVSQNSLSVEEHWIFIFQNDDHRTLQVTENIFFNNTGTEVYNGDVYFWLPEDAEIFAACCNSPNMLCIVRPDNSHACFGPKGKIDDNTYFGNPFNIITPHLSYFGQTGEFTITGEYEYYSFSDNKTYVENRTESLDFTVKLGGADKDRDSINTSGKDIVLNSERSDLGAIWKAVGKSYFIDVVETINITNNDDEIHTLNLSVLGIPEGWFVSLMDDGKIIDIVNITANSSKELTMYVSMPSYIIGLQVEYSTRMDVTGSGIKTGRYEKVSLYQTDALMPVVYQMADDDIEVDNKYVSMFSEWDENIDRNKNYYVGMQVQPDDRFTMTLTWGSEEKETDSQTSTSLPFIALIFLVIVIFVIIMVVRRQGSHELSVKDDVAVEDLREPDDGGHSNSPKKAEYNKALLKLEIDYKDGKISKEIYNELKQRYRTKINGVRSESVRGDWGVKGDLDDLEKKKDMMLEALKKIEKDHDSGKISDEIYAQLKNGYKNKTIKIMKEIDDIKQHS